MECAQSYCPQGYACAPPSGYQCVEGSSGVIGDEAAHAPHSAAEAPHNVVTLPLPPLKLLVTMQDASEENVNANTRPTQARLASQIMFHWEPHLTAAANGINKRSKTLNKLDKLQRIPAKVAAPIFHPWA